VGGGVVEGFPEVVSLRDDPTLMDHQGTDGNLADGRCLSGQFQGSSHHRGVLRIRVARARSGNEHGKSERMARRRPTKEEDNERLAIRQVGLEGLALIFRDPS
jgi:hypothetical protein